jgi:hypothetical protein
MRQVEALSILAGREVGGWGGGGGGGVNTVSNMMSRGTVYKLICE